MSHRSLSMALAALWLCLAIPVQAATPPPLSNPNVTPEAAQGVAYYGALDGGATVSAGGNAAYSIPITVPPGRRGLTPSLSINYNSNVQNGMLGLGWFLSGGSKITRCPKTISQDGVSRPVRYDLEDRYCLDGHKLVAVSGTYGAAGTLYRTEIDQFSSIKSIGTGTNGPTSFTVKTKGGLIMEYGGTSDSRVEGEGSSVVRTWALNRVEDTLSNHYVLNYMENNANGRHYISEIAYNPDVTSVSGGQPNWGTYQAQVLFDYESRPDNVTTYEAGSKVQRHPVRLSGIRTKESGNLVTEYKLTYETVGADSRSRLTEIERCDAAGNCQKPIELDWWHSAVPSYTSSTLTVPHFSATYQNFFSDAAGIGFDYNVPRWHDLNGDGRPDYVHAQADVWGNYPGSNMNFTVKLTNASGGYTTQTWQAGLGGHPKDFHWADIDGDGRTDIVKVDDATKTIRVARSTGSGFDNSSSYDGFAYTYSPLWWAGFSDFKFTDMNGDGLLDFVEVFQPGTYSGGGLVPTHTRVNVQLNNGTDFDSQTTWLNDQVYTKYAFFDATGDGLPDLLLENRYVHANDGTQLDSSSQDFGMTPGNYDIVNFVDVNGDGLMDRQVLKVNGSCCSIEVNTGEAFVHSSNSTIKPNQAIDDNRLADAYLRTGPGRIINSFSSQIPGGTDDDTVVTRSYAENSSGASYLDQTVTYTSPRGAFSQWADIDGDGLADLTLAQTYHCGNPSTTGTWWTTYHHYYCENNQLDVLTADGHALNILKQVTQGQGVETVFTYKPLSDSSVYTKGTSAVFPDYDIQDTSLVVSRMTQSNGIGGVSTVDYTYEGLIRNVQGRGELGYAKITATNVTKGSVTTTEYAQQYPYSSQPIKVQTRRVSDNRLLKQVDTTYATRTTATPDVQFPYVSSRVEKAYALIDGRLLSTQTTTNTQIDAYGNIGDTTVVLQDHENSQTFQTQTTHSFTIDASWANWRVGQVASTTTKAWLNGSNDPSKDRHTAFTYDATTGLLLTQTREPGKGAGIELTTTMAYDAVGNVISETLSGPGMTTRSNTVSYGADYHFPDTVTNALGHTMDQTWDAALGVQLSQTDANNQTTTWTYKGFWGFSPLKRQKSL